ncbi:hypothetical protein R8Z57_07425 [Microbacterium sp. M3]|uniref:Uncharacterized protein n=1 Tax=Microbacterium arthrosphaerae TaxID=792652 RepID=A0ABU4GZU2_9MICO|nr:MULTISPECIES: hypothetical protein [Microbacterium]MDW4572606.1 hypothetical protein [Microbacterium arthrosphaerae]MDW7606461.1 hypothetical protein [Microbacterium sp. M3]
MEDRRRPGVTLEVPTDAVAVRDTVERANQWLRDVGMGNTASNINQTCTVEERAALIQSGTLVAGGLMLVATRSAVEGLRLAVRPRPLQAQKIRHLNFAVRMAERGA